MQVPGSNVRTQHTKDKALFDNFGTMWSPSGNGINNTNNPEEWRKSVLRERRRKVVIAGYLSGQLVGTAAYILSAGRRFNPGAAVGSGAFLGVCLGFGAFIQSF